jgi:hypothetical protein
MIHERREGPGCVCRDRFPRDGACPDSACRDGLMLTSTGRLRSRGFMRGLRFGSPALSSACETQYTTEYAAFNSANA